MVVERLTVPRSEKSLQLTLPLVYKVPGFSHPYAVHPCHPLTPEYSKHVHDWMASFGVNADLGADMWGALVRHDTPALIGDVFADFDLEPRTWLWTMKANAWLFAFDTKVDDTECGINVDESFDLMLDLSLIFLWNSPDNERILICVKTISDSVTSDKAKSLVERFEENLVRARNQTKSIMDIQLVPLAATFRELWLEYCEDVPSGLEMRLAFPLCDYMIGITWEAKNRKANVQHIKIQDYVAFRRLTGAGTVFIACCDLFIARGKSPVSHVPDELYFSSEMQGLLDALSDILCWHNDVISFHKECVLGKDIHNLVKLLAREHNCASYTEAGEIVYQQVNDRIEEMELLYEILRAAARPEFHPAIDLTMKACRNWVAGSHAWHSRSHRFPQADAQPPHMLLHLPC